MEYTNCTELLEHRKKSHESQFHVLFVSCGKNTSQVIQILISKVGLYANHFFSYL